MAIELRGLEGKKVLITGGWKGQGFNHAKAFAEGGCDVALLDIDHDIDDIYSLATPDMGASAVAAIEERGQRAVAIECDIRHEDEVKAAVDKALEFFDGEINVIVNNAGIAALDVIHKMRPSTMNAIIDTNLKGAFHVTKYAADNMIGRREGKIINIGSGVVGSGHSLLSHYVASKWGICGATTAWATEMAEFNINVNAILPATIKPGEGQGSGMVQGLSKEMDMTPEAAFEEFSAAGQMVGSKWRCEMHNITDMVVFLASDNADMITGAIIPVDCGMTAL
ncbi:MAG: SDR family NAD(P)-dependent oxidoreductase [Acidimicrobiales bacterium]